MKAATTIQMRSKGTITVPKELREKYQFAEGSVFTLIDLEDGSLLLSPGVSRVNQLGDQLARSLEEAGITLEEMLEVLDEERERYYREHYLNPRNLSR